MANLLHTKFKDKKVLILGGAGFIGSNLAIRLIELGAQVLIVDSMLPQYGGNLLNLEPIQGKYQINFSDIRDQHSLDYLVTNVDIIFSMAGQTSHIESMSDPMTDLEINCRSQLSILESCRRHNPKVEILYASTRQVYGRPQYLPVDEKHPTCPVDVNGINKLAAENYYTLYAKVYGMKCIAVRLTNTYGPRQHLQGAKQGFAGIFIRRALMNEPITLFGDGAFLRDFNYIDDVVNAFLVASGNAGLYGGVFNLGSREKHTILEFVMLLQRFTGAAFQLVPFPQEYKAIDIGDYYADFTLFEKSTGWTPTTPLTEGLQKTIDYFRPRIRAYC